MFPRKPVSLSISANYKIMPYREEYSTEWDDFVEKKSINGSFLHTRKFYNHHPQNRVDDKSYLFFKQNRLIGVIGCTLQDSDTVLISHGRSTYGGFIVNKHVHVEASLIMVQLLLEEAVKNQVKEIIIRNPFRIFFSKTM